MGNAALRWHSVASGGTGNSLRTLRLFEKDHVYPGHELVPVQVRAVSH